jgi:hypothetical protein
MTKPWKHLCLASLTLFVAIASPQLRQVAADDRYTWKLFDDLKVQTSAGTVQGDVTMDTFGRVTGMPMLQVRLKRDRQTIKEVLLEVVDDKEDFKKAEEACLWTPKGGTQQRLQFKSKIIANAATNADKTVVEVVVVMAEPNGAGGWRAGRAMTNSVPKPLGAGNAPQLGARGAGYVIQSIVNGSAATRVLTLDGKQYSLEAGDTITEIDAAPIRNLDDVRAAVKGKEKITLKILDRRTGNPVTFTAQPRNGILGVW